MTRAPQRFLCLLPLRVLREAGSPLRNSQVLVAPVLEVHVCLVLVHELVDDQLLQLALLPLASITGLAIHGAGKAIYSWRCLTDSLTPTHVVGDLSGLAHLVVEHVVNQLIACVLQTIVTA